MRLMQVMAGAERGGAELFFERLAIAFQREQSRRIDQYIVIRSGARVARLQSHGLHVDTSRFGGPLDIITPFQIRKRARAFDPDVILAWMSRAAKASPHKSGIVCGRLGGYYNLKYFMHCDHLVCNTSDIRRYVVQQGWPGERAHVIPNFVPDPGKASAKQQQMMVRLLALGRFHRNKGFDVLVQAIKDIPDVELVLAGEGPEERNLRALVKLNGLESRIRFVGWQDDIAQLFRETDVLVCPSRHEPLGNVVLDAWAHEVPVIAAAAQGPQQLITDRENGLLVPINDSVALANAIREMKQSDMMRSAIAQAGRAVYEESFSESRVVNAYADFFERVIH